MANQEREEQLFHSCLELPPAELRPYLERACHGDTQLQTRVEQLVAAHRRAEKATLNPVRDVLGALPDLDEPGAAGEERAPAGRAGDTVGPYRLVRLLAEGGMGSVWLAERSDQIVNRPIALKLPHGAWPRAGLAARMAREREILAAFSHANIARLYDAGFTSEGQPYLALEYVEGRPIDEHCRDKGLDLKARLGLFLQVANAVAYAHAKLVVHRDLKPANILVTEDGQVRLLDFGIAKLLEEERVRDSETTRLAGRAFTLDYASPEQIAGEPITIGSDVYSLGVVLYELLTDARPYKPARDSWGALEETILNTDPARPSDAARGPFRRTLRGDLDTIVLKALKKKPPDRYATVNAFVEDIERYLRGQPVVAQPDRAWYRLSKFVARNRLAVSAGAIVLLAVLAGAGIAVWQARVATAEKNRAEEVKEFIASIFRDTDPYLRSEGKPLTAIDLLKQARQRLDKELATQPRVRVELLGVLGRSYLGLLDTRNAEAALAQALREGEAALSPDDLLTIRVRLWLSETKYYLGQAREAREHLSAASTALVRSRRTGSAEFVDAKLLQTVFAINDADYDEAEKSALEAVETSTRVLGATNDLTAQGLFMLAMIYRNQNKLDLALSTAEKAYRLQLEIRKKDAKHPTVIDAQMEYGRALAAVGTIDAAAANLKEAVANARELYGQHNLLTGNFLASLARVQIEYGEIGPGIENARESLSILAAEGSPSEVDHASRERALGDGLLAARRASEALPHLRRAAEVGSRTKDEHGLLLSRADYGLALVYLGRFQDAETELQQVVAERRAGRARAIHQPLSYLGTLRRLEGRPDLALTLFEEASAAARNRPLNKVDLAQVLTGIGITRLETSDYDEAVRSLNEARALLEEVQKEKTPARADALVGLGRAKMGQGRLAEALPLLEAADRFWHEFDAENRWAGEAALWLGRCYAALGRAADARQALARAEKLLSRSPIPSDSRLARLAGQR